MPKDYAKATQELLERLRRQVSLPPLPGTSDQPAPVQHIYINAPKDCVFYLSPPPGDVKQT